MLLHRTLSMWASVTLSELLSEQTELTRCVFAAWRSMVVFDASAAQADVARREAFITRQGSVMRLLARQVEASRSVLSTVIASNMELVVYSALCAWREACNEDSKARETRTEVNAYTPTVGASSSLSPGVIADSRAEARSTSPVLSRSPSSDGYQEGDWYANYHGDLEPEL